MKRTSRFIAFIMAIITFFSLTCTVLAADAPTLPEPIEDYDPSHNDPIGVATPEEISAAYEEANNCSDLHSTSGIQPRHVHYLSHSHTVTKITETYTGETYRGIVYTHDNPYENSTQAHYSEARSVSNSYSVSIGFTAAAVTAGTGITFSGSVTKTAGCTVNVPAYKRCQVKLWDVYTVKKFNVQTRYIGSGGVTLSTETGTGWAQQWIRFRTSYSLSNL